MSMDYERAAPVERTVPGEVSSLSGLTVQQAKEFNKLFIGSFLIFTLVAFLAHVAAYAWRPWGKAQPVTPPVAATQIYAAPTAAPAYSR